MDYEAKWKQLQHQLGVEAAISQDKKQVKVFEHIIGIMKQLEEDNYLEREYHGN